MKRVYSIGSKEAVDMARSLCGKHGLMVEIGYGVNMLVELRERRNRIRWQQSCQGPLHPCPHLS